MSSPDKPSPETLSPDKPSPVMLETQKSLLRKVQPAQQRIRTGEQPREETIKALHAADLSHLEKAAMARREELAASAKGTGR